MTTEPSGDDLGADDLGAGADEDAARRRHPSTHPWRTDHDGLASRLAAHLQATGWAAAAACAEAEEARATARRG